MVAVIPVSSMLSMKQIAKAAGGKKAEMAKGADVERSSGYILGGVSPLGQKKRLRTFINGLAENFPTILLSAGRRVIGDYVLSKCNNFCCIYIRVV